MNQDGIECCLDVHVDGQRFRQTHLEAEKLRPSSQRSSCKHGDREGLGIAVCVWNVRLTEQPLMQVRNESLELLRGVRGKINSLSTSTRSVSEGTDYLVGELMAVSD